MATKLFIRQITDAEAEATEIRRRADREAAALVNRASVDGEELCEQARKRAKEENAVELAAVKRKAEATIDENRRAAYENAATMSSCSEARMAEAATLLKNAVLQKG